MGNREDSSRCLGNHATNVGVWLSDFSFLESLDKKIKEFIWSGQEEAARHPRLDYNLLTKAKEEGGQLALISVKD